MSGAPPQHDLFDFKPKLNEFHMKECPPELIKGQTFAFIKGTPKLLGTPYKFAQYGQSGAWVSEMLPHFQTIVDDEKRGRVMGFYTMAFLGTAPFGSLIAGWLSSSIGAAHTLQVGGVCCMLGALWFASALPAIRAAVRPIYVRLGILPEIASGLANAAELSVPPTQG